MATINCDMGESYGIYKLGDDEALMPFLDIANVACGFHGSDFNHMRETVRLAKRYNVGVGAHPSLPDLQGFGRREMKMKREELANCLIYQIGALVGFLSAEGIALNHIKPHGALYGMAAREEEIAHGVADAALVFNKPVLGMAGTLHEKVYRDRGIEMIPEFYADLHYNDQGGLIITRVHDAVNPQEAAEKCRRAIAEGKVKSVGGVDIPVGAETICIHSDTPNAVDIAAAVRNAVSRPSH